MAERTRPIMKPVYFTKEEWQIVQGKMHEGQVTNFSSFAREMLLQGEIKHYDFSALKEQSAIIGRIAGNINQIAKRCNENHSVHTNDVEQLRQKFLELKADYQERVMKLLINMDSMRRYLNHLKEQERSAATLQKYGHDLNELCCFLQGRALTKAALIDWKQALVGQYAPASVNSMLTVANGYLRYMGWQGLCVRLLKVQKSLFLDENKELSRAEYARLVRAAQTQKNERLALVLQTICATGIRVSELQFITAEAVQAGRAEICNKGKRRLVFLPDKLRRMLKAYLRRQKKTAGAVFTTRTGRPLDRSNIWRDMKALCKSAGVAPEKVFPHNLRHLFARVFYALEKDLSRLADILGHSSVNTTRIYTAESGAAHARQMNRLGLIVT